jgi:hypothetical protein
MLLAVLHGSAWRLTLVQAEGVTREGGKEASVRDFTMNEHASTGVPSLPTVAAPPALLHAPPTWSASDPMRPSNVAMVDEASSGVMQGLEALSHETTPTTGFLSLLVDLRDRRLKPSSPSDVFHFSSTSTPGWSTGGDGTCSFSRLSGRTPSDYTGPSAGVGGSGYYYYAEASSPRVQGDLFTLTYDGSVCASSGLLVTTVRFSFHMYGSTMGTLSLINAAGVAIWSLSGDQGNAWLSVSVALFSASFRFEYVRGGGNTGDAAVAQVAVSCAAAPPTPTMGHICQLLHLLHLLYYH